MSKQLEDHFNVASSMIRKSISETQEILLRQILKMHLNREVTIEDAKNVTLMYSPDFNGFRISYCNKVLGNVHACLDFNVASQCNELKFIFTPC